jgi:hypothetical protein
MSSKNVRRIGNCSVKILLSLLGNGSVKIPLSLLGNDSVEHYRANEYTLHNRIIVGRVILNVARVVSRKVGDQFFPELPVLIRGARA